MKKSNKRNRKIVINSMVFTLLLLTVSFVAQSTFNVSGDDPLQFPVNDYTEETTTYGSTTVTYRLYRHIAYVANPVDLDYQSLDVAVPVTINGTDVDTANAPIILVANNGGYMASSNLATGSGRLLTANNGRSSMAAGYVVVIPGLRGWDLEANGTYYGKAPAAQVDLKAAVRYIRYNDGIMPGNSEWIVVNGKSGGGAQSALLGVSGNSPLFDAALEEIGAADATDEIFASAPYCPITDLDHADMAYEWEFGTTPIGTGSELVNQTLSQQLKDAFSVYQASLNLQGKNGFGTITAENYGDYLVEAYLIPSANKYLNAMTEESRDSYLSSRTWITWSDGSASFTFEDYVAYITRYKGLPAFDAFDLSAWENGLFGNSTTDRRHFTNYSLQQDSGDPSAEIDSELQTIVNMMNPMYFIQQNNTDCAQYWFIRTGTKDRDTAHTILGNLATSLENNGKDVNASLYWDAGHGTNMDADAFVEWVSQITGYPMVPGGLTLGVMLLLSTIAVIVSISYYRKRPKWQNW